jgi:hypothetical protein
MSRGNHPIEQEELMAYLDGELSSDRAAAAVAHLEQCQECQRLAADLRDVSQKLRDWQVGSSGPATMRGLAAALEEREGKQESSGPVSPGRWRDVLRMRRLWVGGLVAASLVLVAVISLIGRNVEFRKMHQPIESAGNGALGKLQASQEAEPPPPPAAPSAGPVNNRTFDRLEPFVQHGSAGRVGDLASNDFPSSGPMIERTARLSLITREFDKARAEFEDVLKRHRGYFSELNVSAPVGTGRTLNATLRVPADQLEITIGELRKLGRVESESQSGEDVTSQYVDLEARLSNARNTERRLTDLLRQRTGRLADVLAVENEINRVRGEIEGMEAERKNLANRVRFASLNATVTEDYRAQLQVVPPSTSTRFRNAAVDGYRTVVDGVVGMAVFLVSSGPSLLFWGGLLFFPVRSVWRRLRRATAQ